MNQQTTTPWQTDRLDTLISTIIDHRGKTPKKMGGSWANKGIPAISAKNVKGGRIVNKQDIKYVDENLYNKWMRIKLKTDDVLLTSEAPLGELYLLRKDEDYVLSQRLFGLRTHKNKLLGSYLFYFLSSGVGQHELKRRISGTAAEGIRQEELRQIKITYPTNIMEQEKIVDYLISLDYKIEVNNQIAKKLEEMAQAIFKEWFVNFRFPGYEKVKFVESEVRKIPEGWEIGKLGNVMEFIYGKALKEEDRREGNVLVVGSSGIVGKHNQKLVTGPGIVIGRKGNVGSILWVNEDFYPIDTTYYIESKYNLYFCYFLLLRQKFISGDSAVPGLNREQAYSNRVIVPSLETANLFKHIVGPAMDMKNNLINENRNLTRLRDLLLPKLMRGEVKGI